MKCLNCNGQRYKAPDVPCGRCGGKGVVEPLTNEEYFRSCTFEELAGAIYEWHTKGYTKGRLEAELNPITEVVEWLKEKHNAD